MSEIRFVRLIGSGIQHYTRNIGELALAHDMSGLIRNGILDHFLVIFFKFLRLPHNQLGDLLLETHWQQEILMKELC